MKRFTQFKIPQRIRGLGSKELGKLKELKKKFNLKKIINIIIKVFSKEKLSDLVLFVKKRLVIIVIIIVFIVKSVLGSNVLFDSNQPTSNYNGNTQTEIYLSVGAGESFPSSSIIKSDNILIVESPQGGSQDEYDYLMGGGNDLILTSFQGKVLVNYHLTIDSNNNNRLNADLRIVKKDNKNSENELDVRASIPEDRVLAKFYQISSFGVNVPKYLRRSI